MSIDRSLICLFIGFLCTANVAVLGSSQEMKSLKSEGAKGGQGVESDTGKLFWIFLTTGKSTDGVDPEEVSAMQKAHLDNFKRLAGEGKLLTAGPMSDPDEKLRGIVVVKAKDPEDLAKYFLDDPYIAKGYLRIEATEMKIQHGVINTNIAPQGLEEYLLVVFERDGSVAKMDESQQLENRKVLSSLSTAKEILLAVDLTETQYNRTGLMIFTKPENDPSLVNRLKEIPAVKSGNWKSRTFNLYMGKGTLVKAG